MIKFPTSFFVIVENLCKLDACSKNMSIKKLLKEGITYNSLKTIFEECCSFMDFYETMKSYGIERKVSKVIALHFSGKGLENQGARPYSKLHEEKPVASSSTQESTEGQANRGHPLQRDHSDSKEEAKVPSEKSQPDSKSCNQVEGGEDWESEVVPCKNFTLKCTTPTPLSLDVDDFSSAQSGKTRGKESPRVKHQSPPSYNSSKVVHSCSSEVNESQHADVTGKKPLGKATPAEVRGRTYHSRSNCLTESSDKRGGRLNKAVKERKLESRTKKEALVSRKGNKKGFLKEKTPKSTDAPKESPDTKEREPSVKDISSSKQESSSKIDLQFQGSACDQSSSGEDSLGKGPNNSTPTVTTVTPPLDSDLSAAEVVQKFTSVFIGDIAILVPVENSGQGFYSDKNVLDETGSVIQDPADNITVARCDRGADTSPTNVESSTDVMKPGKLESICQSESNAYHAQSAHEALEGLLEDQAEKASKTKCEEGTVVDIEKANSSTCETLVDNLELSEGSPKVSNPMESSFPAVMTTDSNRLTGANTEMSFDNDNITENGFHQDKNISKDNDAVKSTEEKNHEEATFDNGVASGTVRDPLLLLTNESSHSESAVGEFSSTGIPWQELQQMPHASLPQDFSNQPTPGRFIMSEGLACHVMNTDDVDHIRHDLQAELSSESSSTSGDSMDTFSRQPPLGAERGFTPDTVQQQPDQPAWVGSMNDGIYPMPSAPGVNYPQASFPSFANPYGTFHQAQQALPLLKPCYSSFGYINHMRPIVPPHMMQPHHQVFMSPYLQYRNQVMLSNTVPPVGGFPSAAMPPSQFQPQMYQVWQGPTGYTCPPVPFYGNPYEQSQESTGAMLDVNCTHSTTVLPQVSPAVEYSSPMMDLSVSPVNDVREESSSEVSSSSSSDSPFELMNGSAKSGSFHPVCDHSTLHKDSFPVQMENDQGFSMLVDNGVDQNETKQELKGALSCEAAESQNANQVFSLAQLCYKEVSDNDKENINKLVDTCHLNSSKEGFTHHVSKNQEEPVHKQIMILSRESAVDIGRRLSPDGSSVDGISFDSPSDASSAQSIEIPLKENNKSASIWHHLSQEFTNCRASDVSGKGRSPFPKPQRLNGSRSRRNKRTQPRSVSVLTQNDHQKVNDRSSSNISGASPHAIPGTVPSENTKCSNKHGDQKPSVAASKKKTEDSQRTVRFSNEHIEYDSGGDHSCRWKKVESVEKHFSSTCSPDQNMNGVETSQSRSMNRTVAKPLRIEGSHAGSLHEGTSQRHTEKRGPIVDSKSIHSPGNSGKRVYNDRARRRHTDKQSRKHPSRVKDVETDRKTDSNNNSG